MSAIQSPAVDLQQVKQLWSMLDELSDNDPESYRTFMQRHLTEGSEFCSPPQPHACLRTVIQEPKAGLLYINLCGWRRVPAPQSRSHPVPVSGGRLETCSDDNGTYSVVDIAFSPSVLQGAQESPQEREQLHLLALGFTQQQHGLRLSQDYTVLSDRLKGTAESMRRRLASKRQDTPSSPAPSPSSGPSLLQQITSLRGDQSDSKDDPPVLLNPQNRAGPAKPALIQVISSTESAQPRTPKHQLSTTTDANGVAKTVQLTVELPGVQSVSECELNLSQDDVVLEVGDVFHLHLQLPEAVREEEAGAVFNRKKCTLTVTMPVL